MPDYQSYPCGGPECTKKAFECCDRCKAVHYCGVECQRRHWSLHKTVCAEPALTESKAAEVTSEAKAENLAEDMAEATEEDTAVEAGLMAPTKVYSGLDCRVNDFHCANPACTERVRDLPKEGSDMCSGCRAVVYCGQSCLEMHWPGHKLECYYSLLDRIQQGNAHKDDSGGEYVLVQRLEDCKNTYGDTDRRTIQSASVLATFYRILGKLDDAERLSRYSLKQCRALQTLNNNGCLDSPDECTLASMNNLALLLFYKGK